MGDNKNLFSLRGKSPIFQLFISLMVVVGTGLFLFSLFFVAGQLIFNPDRGLLDDPFYSVVGGENIIFLRYLLISQHLSFFIGPAILLLFCFNPFHEKGFYDMKKPIIKDIILVIILACSIIPVTSFTGQLNAGMHLPQWLSGVEQWMIRKENSTIQLTGIIMTQDSFPIMLLNLLMIAILPAIGEELIFRGIFQKIFYRIFRSGNLAIWVTAFIFSAIHLQFFGFLPRFILGLIFGYLFLWSGNLWMPVIAHFVNNAISVIVSYIQSPDSASGSPDIPFSNRLAGLAFSLIIFCLILLYFRDNRTIELSADFNEPGLDK
jgi:membrane protease YdiL (CAAX protease family)